MFVLRHRTVFFLLTAAALAAPAATYAADWPQWLGPNRTGISTETGLLRDWPKGGPPLKWKVKDLGGESYSAPSVAKGMIYLLCDFEKSEHLVALDEKDGHKVWSLEIGKIGANPASGDNFHPGPRGTPTVDGDKIYSLCSAGELVCVDLVKRSVVWTRNLKKDFAGKPGSWAYTESPLIDGDVVVASPGGTSATIVALNKNDGKTIWKAKVPGGDKAAYGSPIVGEVGGIKQYVCFLSNGMAAVAAKDGEFLWRYDEACGKNGINIATPIFHDGHVFSVAGYNSGGGLVKLTADNGKVSANQVWFNKGLTSVQAIGGFVRVGEHIYGTAKPGKGGTLLVCAELKTGKIVWQHACVEAGALCMADGLLYVRGQGNLNKAKSEIALVEATPAGYKEHGRFSQPDRSKQRAWPYPVLANGCLYLRDIDVLLCYDVRDQKKFGSQP